MLLIAKHWVSCQTFPYYFLLLCVIGTASIQSRENWAAEDGAHHRPRNYPCSEYPCNDNHK